MARLTPLLKLLLPVALVLPIGAFVLGTLAATDEDPAPRAPLEITDAPPPRLDESPGAVTPPLGTDKSRDDRDDVAAEETESTTDAEDTGPEPTTDTTSEAPPPPAGEEDGAGSGDTDPDTGGSGTGGSGSTDSDSGDGDRGEAGEGD